MYRCLFALEGKHEFSFSHHHLTTTVVETGTCLHGDRLHILSSVCPDFTSACQLVELIDAAWHKVEEEETLTLAAISLFFADKNSWLHALQSVHKGPLLETLSRTLESAPCKIYSTCAAVYLSRSLRAGPDRSTVESLTRSAASSHHSQPRLGFR